MLFTYRSVFSLSFITHLPCVRVNLTSNVKHLSIRQKVIDVPPCEDTGMKNEYVARRAPFLVAAYFCVYAYISKPENHVLIGFDNVGNSEIKTL